MNIFSLTCRLIIASRKDELCSELMRPAASICGDQENDKKGHDLQQLKDGQSVWRWSPKVQSQKRSLLLPPQKFIATSGISLQQSKAGAKPFQNCSRTRAPAGSGACEDSSSTSAPPSTTSTNDRRHDAQGIPAEVRHCHRP